MPTRRDFVRLSATGLALGLVPHPLVAGLRADPHLAGGPADPHLAGGRTDAFRELRRGVGTFTGRGGTIGWLVRPEGGLVVDSQFPDTAVACLEGMEARGGVPLHALINTHHHGDHVGGNGVFRAAARRIVAHERVPALQRRAAAAAGTEGAQVYADTTFPGDWVLELGDERVRASYRGPAHTGGDCTVTFEAAGVVHMGDLVFNRLFPFVDRAGGASVRGWLEVLEAVAAEHPADTLYIFGHGRDGFGVTGTREDLLHQRDFFAALLETATRALAAGQSREEATRLEQLPGFADHVAPGGRLTLASALGAAWDELTGGDGGQP
jgi:cyclase